MPSPNLSAVGLIAKPRSERAATLVPELIAWLDKRGIAVRLDEECAIYAGRTNGLSRAEVAEQTQLLVVLGEMEHCSPRRARRWEEISHSSR